jgi:hypothetical protein
MLAEDPDNEDPSLIPSRGIVRYLLDGDGDGVFDQETGGLYVDLGFNYTYTRIGNYFPVLRVEDGDGLTADSRSLFPVLVQIFASFSLLGGIALSGRALSFAPLWINGGDALLLALSQEGYGFAMRHPTYPAFTWKTRGIPDPPSMNLDDIVAIGNLGVGADPQKGLVFYSLKGTDPAITPDSPQGFTCPSGTGGDPGASSAELTYDPEPPPTLLLSLRDGSGGITQVLFFDPSTWGTDLPDPLTLCPNLSPFAILNFDPSRIPGGAFSRLRALAPSYPWLFALIEGSTSVTIATYAITAPSDLATGSPLCAPLPESCVSLGSVSFSAITTLTPPPFLDLPLTYAVQKPDHYELPLTHYLDPSAPITLYAGASSYPAGPSTFQLLNPLTLRLETTFYTTIITSSPVTLAGGTLPLLLVGGGDRIQLYSFFLTSPALRWITEGSGYPFRVDELLGKDGVIYVADRSSRYIPFSENPNLNPWERQRRGLYALPLSDLSFYIRLLPRNESFSYLDTYPGPLRLKPGYLPRVIHSLNGGTRIEGYRVDPYELTARFAKGERTKTLWLEPFSLVLSDFTTRVEIDPETGRGFVAAGDQGIVAFSGGGELRWVFSQDLGSAPMTDLDFLPRVTESSLPLFSGTIGKSAWVWSTDGTPLATFSAPGESYLDFESVPAFSIDTPGKAILSLRVVTQGVEELRMVPITIGTDPLALGPRMILPRDLPALGSDLSLYGRFLFGELDDLARLRVKHRYLWFSSGTIACIDRIFGSSCPSGEEIFTNGPRGNLLRVLSRGVPYIAQIDTATGLLNLYDMNGDLITQTPFSICARVPMDEQRLCAQSFSIRDLKSVDPYLLVVTAGGIFVLDLYKPSFPQLAVWIKGGLVGGVSAVLLGDRMRIYYTEGGDHLRVLEVQGLYR